MEPVDFVTVNCVLGTKGRIYRADDELAYLLDYSRTSVLYGTKLSNLVPNLRLDVGDCEQFVCGICPQGHRVPLIVTVAQVLDPDTNELFMYEVRIRALTSINGAVMIHEDGSIHSYNSHFFSSLLGIDVDKHSMRNRLITDILPNFYTADRLQLSILTNEIENDNKSPCHLLDNLLSMNLLDPIESGSSAQSSSSTDETDNNKATLEPPTRNKDDNMNVAICSLNECLFNRHKDQRRNQLKEGVFSGFVKHEDGSMIEVRYDVHRMYFLPDKTLWAVCISYDHKRNKPPPPPVSSAEKIDPNDHPKVHWIVGFSQGSNPSQSSPIAEEQPPSFDEKIFGVYSEYYNTLERIGNGAFGTVKLASRKTDEQLVVTKFVCKRKVLPDCWLPSFKRANRLVPSEVHLLELLSHPNIVTVLDVFENDNYYQLVMEKLGCGMDLYEFIELFRIRWSHSPSVLPKMDDALIRFIFKQIILAVHYLHSKSIVHRDLKDENVIIDEHFRCKLIDFGSAAYFGRGILFSTFCGTIEYCSPEVLNGNKYGGPELEMWSLGVLLYTLIFFDNPFRTAQETVRADLDLPSSVSEGLYQVLTWLLESDPRSRATVTEVKNHWWIRQEVDIERFHFEDVIRMSDVFELFRSKMSDHKKD